MNKKFSTLVAGVLLASGVGVILRFFLVNLNSSGQVLCFRRRKWGN